jgi:hypothetical protein
MITNRYQYIFAIVLLLLIHISIMFLWIGNINQPASLNTLHSGNKIPQNNHVQTNIFNFNFTNY